MVCFPLLVVVSEIRYSHNAKKQKRVMLRKAALRFTLQIKMLWFSPVRTIHNGYYATLQFIKCLIINE